MAIINAPKAGDVIRYRGTKNVRLWLGEANGGVYLQFAKGAGPKQKVSGRVTKSLAFSDYDVICNIFDPDIDWSKFIT